MRKHYDKEIACGLLHESRVRQARADLAHYGRGNKSYRDLVGRFREWLAARSRAVPLPDECSDLSGPWDVKPDGGARG
jgi:hypothetical protein